jgi:hypothetical protein
MCRLGEERRSGRREGLEPRGEVRRIADGRVVHLQVVADGADDDRPGVDADARLEVEPALRQHGGIERRERPVNRDGGEDGAFRRVLVRHRGPEERHQAVAGERVHDALESVDLAERHLEVALDELAVLLGIELLGDRRRADEVAEHHGDLLALALDDSLRGEDLVRERLGYVLGDPRRHGRRHRGHVAVHRESAVRTEAERGRQLGPAPAAGERDRRSTAVAEPFARDELRVARRTPHVLAVRRVIDQVNAARRTRSEAHG